jgi:hypothetical protein
MLAGGEELERALFYLDVEGIGVKQRGVLIRPS